VKAKGILTNVSASVVSTVAGTMVTQVSEGAVTSMLPEATGAGGGEQCESTSGEGAPPGKLPAATLTVWLLEFAQESDVTV